MEHPYRFGLLCTLLIATAAIYIAPSCTTVKHINPPIQLSDDKTQLEVNTELLSEIETVLKENVNSQAKEAGVKVVKLEVAGIYLSSGKNSALARMLLIHTATVPETDKEAVGIRLDIVKLDLVKNKWQVTNVYNIKPFTPILTRDKENGDAGVSD